MDQIAALRGAFGSNPDTSTIRGLRQYIELWLQKDAMAPTSGLVQGCQEMANRLADARLATEADLETTGDTDESLADPTERCIEAYAELQEIVEDIGREAPREIREPIKELDEELADAAEFLRQAQQDLESWVADPVLRCPRCGSREGDPCPKCGLELLVLDPNGGTGAGDRSALLPPQYGRVYELFEDVRGGRQTLSALIESLATIEREAVSFQTLVQMAQTEAQNPQTLEETSRALAGMREGLELMKGTAQSRRLVELQAGWLKVFRNAVRMQRLRLKLLEELGGEEGRRMAQTERASVVQQDSVTLSGD